MTKKHSSFGEVDLAEGVIPITKASASLSELIKRARVRHEPIVVTQNGYPVAALLDIESFTRMRKYAEQYLEYLAATNDHNQAEQSD